MALDTWMIQSAGTNAAGTVIASASSGVITVSGTGTAFLANVGVGDILKKVDQTPLCRVISVQSDISLTAQAITSFNIISVPFQIVKSSIAVVGQNGISYNLISVDGFYTPTDAGKVLVPGPAVVPAGALTPAWVTTTAPTLAPAVVAPPVADTQLYNASPTTTTAIGQNGITYTVTSYVALTRNTNIVPRMVVNALVAAGWTTT